ncbi:MAG: Adaptive-response sensory-kinase SasA [Gemmatimonadaceae bacterium]|nr:Adaptive-response sensory-kinase SasA [Gemmatimonadaceae bacterium]
MPPERPRTRVPVPHERRVLLLALCAGLPGVVGTLVLLNLGGYSSKVAWTVGALVAGIWLAVAFALRERVIRPLQTLSNMLAALREGDFSLRARFGDTDDALGLALMEINLLGDTLRNQRLGAMEATALLRAVMQEIDVAIFAFDGDATLRLANRAAERLLAQPSERLVSKRAATLGLAEFLDGSVPRVSDRAFPARSGRWEIRRTTFRQDGRPHTLVVITDVTRALREEELLAWQRLVRVLSHEINNSLAPIKSLAGSLARLLDRPKDGDETRDLRHGLGVIEGRADALARFMSAYARLAKLPPPQRRELDVGPWMRHVVALETRAPVKLDPGPDVTVRADSDQLEQALINLIRNAVDAARETSGGVLVTWSANADAVEVTVADDGPGLSGGANLFVPFYTTKPDGTGIGLVLSRQVAEAHGGTVTLENRRDRGGALATLRIRR